MTGRRCQGLRPGGCCGQERHPLSLLHMRRPLAVEVAWTVLEPHFPAPLRAGVTAQLWSPQFPGGGFCGTTAGSGARCHTQCPRRGYYGVVHAPRGHMQEQPRCLRTKGLGGARFIPGTERAARTALGEEPGSGQAEDGDRRGRPALGQHWGRSSAVRLWPPGSALKHLRQESQLLRPLRAWSPGSSPPGAKPWVSMAGGWVPAPGRAGLRGGLFLAVSSPRAEGEPADTDGASVSWKL